MHSTPTAPLTVRRRTRAPALVTLAGLAVLLGAMAADALAGLGETALVAVMLAGLLVFVGGGSVWLSDAARD
jgi:hypothetical protein